MTNQRQRDLSASKIPSSYQTRPDVSRRGYSETKRINLEECLGNNQLVFYPTTHNYKQINIYMIYDILLERFV
uniref:Uncharacterized protein n=1 Tax=Nelumbo nucifera TaxID=4432 RepID=A0A822Z7K6_NELNU|nr:TPA_asm: hypothetical protein HUJ06_014913 [Nelumbo nucifera]